MSLGGRAVCSLTRFGLDKRGACELKTRGGKGVLERRLEGLKCRVAPGIERWMELALYSPCNCWAQLFTLKGCTETG